VGGDDRASRRRRGAAARLECVRQHRDLPGGPPDALAAVLRGGRARRGGARADRGEHAHPAHDLRRPRRAGGGVLRRRARAPGARDAPRAGGARAADGGADRLHRASRAAGDPHLARRHRHVHRLPRLGRDRDLRRADHGDGDDRRRRGHRRPPGVGADGARVAQQHAVVRPRLRLPRRALRADPRSAEHGRRVPGRQRADEAGHRDGGRDAGRVVDARRHGLPGGRRAERRARAAHPRPRAGRRRGGQHARDLRRRAARRKRPVRVLRADRRHLGRHADLGRERRPDESRQPRGEHPRRGGRVGVPDRGRALRARARHRWSGRASRGARDRAGLAMPHAAHLADRAVRPRAAAALRALWR